MTSISLGCPSAPALPNVCCYGANMRMKSLNTIAATAIVGLFVAALLSCGTQTQSSGDTTTDAPQTPNVHALHNPRPHHNANLIPAHKRACCDPLPGHSGPPNLPPRRKRLPYTSQLGPSFPRSRQPSRPRRRPLRPNPRRLQPGSRAHGRPRRLPDQGQGTRHGLLPHRRA